MKAAAAAVNKLLSYAATCNVRIRISSLTSGVKTHESFCVILYIANVILFTARYYGECGIAIASRVSGCLSVRL